MRLCVFVASVAVPLFAVSVPVGKGRQLDTDLSSINAFKPEIRADLLLQLAVTQSAQRQQVLEEAFLAADGAQYKYPEQVGPGSPADSPAGIKAEAFRLGVDSLSLKTRALRELLTVNPKRAVELFALISRPSLSATTCSDFTIGDFTPYYDTLGALSSSGVGARLTLADISPFVAPSEPTLSDILGVTRLLTTSKVSDALFDEALGYLQSDLHRASANTEALRLVYQPLGEALQSTMRVVYLRQRSNAALLSAIRSFLITELQGVACLSNGAQRQQYDRMKESLATLYNTHLGTLLYSPNGSVEALNAGDITPRTTEPAGNNASLFADSDVRALQNAVRQQQVTSDVSGALSTIDSFRSSTLTVNDVFNVQAIMYRAMANSGNLSPSQRHIVLSGYIAFIQRSAETQSYSLVWLLHAKELLVVVAKAKESLEITDPVLLAYRSIGARGV
ncbi:MAG: hypothetical protein M3Y50_12235 [Acidobacteriota bacterium]|nr:hypothetical protein [Acidobacteriota bacterium]